MITHLQSYFCLKSLGTQMKIEVLLLEYISICIHIHYTTISFKAIGEYTHHIGHKWWVDQANYSSLASLTIKERSVNADLWVYLCRDGTTYAGLADIGTLCEKGYLLSMLHGNDRPNVLGTAEIVTHEMGHNLGMMHDVDVGCSKNSGFMSGAHNHKWSFCSRNQLLILYNRLKKENNWCLPCMYSKILHSNEID